MPEWWFDRRYTYGSAVFEPRQIPAAKLEQGRMRLYNRFYTRVSLLNRLCEVKANASSLGNLLAYVGLNWPANAEERMRYCQPLGASL